MGAWGGRSIQGCCPSAGWEIPSSPSSIPPPPHPRNGCLQLASIRVACPSLSLLVPSSVAPLPRWPWAPTDPCAPSWAPSHLPAQSQPRRSHHPQGGNGRRVSLSAPSHRRKVRARPRPEPCLGPLPVPWHPWVLQVPAGLPSPPLLKERGSWRWERCAGTLVTPGTVARVKRSSRLPAGPDHTAAAEL